MLLVEIKTGRTGVGSQSSLYRTSLGGKVMKAIKMKAHTWAPKFLMYVCEHISNTIILSKMLDLTHNGEETPTATIV